jgi:AGCS family alanine or glycine:cation symporter
LLFGALLAGGAAAQGGELPAAQPSAAASSARAPSTAPAPHAAPELAPPTDPEAVSDLNEALSDALGNVNAVIARLLFFNVSGDLFQAQRHEQGRPVFDEAGLPVLETVPVPFVVLVLALGGVFFTIWYRFVNVRGFRHAIDIVRGKYDNPEDVGEISHFRALTSALSATVGLGNIAGVAIAIQLGGPGAVFWMVTAAFFGMSVKFSSCTLAQLYRRENADGSISGGPMYYLDLGFRSWGGLRAKFGKGLAVLYAFMIMGGSFGGGNMFQANQSFEAFSGAFGIGQQYAWVFGLVLAALVGAVILGGIKRIGAATSRIVPGMVAIYVAASVVVLVANFRQIPAALALIVEMAFTDNAAYGGIVGVLVWGVKRASFSNEAGLGSSAIAHAAARTKEPVREGLVAMMEPFIDTIIVCVMTALVVIVSGAWSDPNIPQSAGVSLTAAAFETVLPWFPKLLAVCVLLFAYSTMISWCYYGERGWIYLLDQWNGRGLATVSLFRVVFVCFVFFGAVAKLGAVLDFSDLLILCMAFPNILGSVLLAPRLRRVVEDYFRRMQAAGGTPATSAQRAG